MEKILDYGKAICYSGYRQGQSPKTVIPSKEEIAQDLDILVADGYKYLRMYDPNLHARRVLEIIREKKLPLKCIIGIDSDPEIANKNCPFERQDFSEQELLANAARNDAELEKLIELTNEYKDEIVLVSVGNENTPDWGAHLVPVERLIFHAKRLKEGTGKPVTFCEGAGEWKKLGALGNVLDVISIHSYPLHNRVGVDGALDMNKSDYKMVQEWFPDKQVIFTEAGWSCTPARHMVPEHASEENQKKYIDAFNAWIEEEKIIACIFEAFDEPWKGSKPESSECNWGLYYVDRTPKPVMKRL